MRLLGALALVVACWLVPHAQARADDIAQAYAKCQTELANINSQGGISNVQPCVQKPQPYAGGPLGGFQTSFYQYGGGPNLATFWSYYVDCPSGQTFDRTSGTCKAPCSTSAPPLADGLYIQGDYNELPSIYTCQDGCNYLPPAGTTTEHTLTIDGQVWTAVGGWVAAGSSCAAGTPTTSTPPSDTDGDGTSDSKDGAPGNPGSDGTDDPNDTDPTCGGEGQAKCADKTDGTDHTSTGGGDCSTPPQSSGDPILAQIAFQTWATRCQLVKNANTGTAGQGGGTAPAPGTAAGGGDCSTPPITSGDVVTGMVATQAWATRCAVQAGNSVSVTGDVGDCAHAFTVNGPDTDANVQKLRAMRAQICHGDADGDGKPDWTKTDGTEAGDGDSANDGTPGLFNLGISTDWLDQTGFLGGGGGQCVSLGVLDFGPLGTFSLDDLPWWCQLITILHAIVLFMGTWLAIRILLD